MLRIDPHKRTLEPVMPTKLADAGVKERSDLQQMICRSPEAFFTEIGETLLLIGEEVKPSETVDNRVDLLALDPEGVIVVIELKRGTNRYQLLQAISYAAMISQWDPQSIIKLRGQLCGTGPEDAAEAIDSILTVEPEAINVRQRILLVAEDFEYEVLASVEWLHKQYQVDIRCFRLQLAQDGDAQYVSCTAVYPLPAIEDQTRRRTRKVLPSRWGSWEEVIATVENPAITTFLTEELHSGRKTQIKKRRLIFNHDGATGWGMRIRKRHVYVRQYGRFDGDIAFWKERFGNQTPVAPVAKGNHIRFQIDTTAQFAAFRKAISDDLSQIRLSRDGITEVSG